MDTRFTEWPIGLNTDFNDGIRVLTCNLRSGGSGRNTPKLLDELLRWNPHTLVLTEFRMNDVGKKIVDRLKRGHYNVAFTDVEFGVFIASKDEFTPNYNPMLLASNDGKVLEAEFAVWRLYGIYLPQDELKSPHFEHLLTRAALERQPPSVAIGDFNTGRNTLDIEPFRHEIPSGTAFTSEKQFLRLEKLWTEAWRAMHPDGDQYSIYFPRYKLGGYSGYRIDHCFLSPSMRERLRNAAYIHRTRQLNLTNHSALIVDLSA